MGRSSGASKKFKYHWPGQIQVSQARALKKEEIAVGFKLLVTRRLKEGAMRHVR
jgi:hypothetical protein